MNKYLALVSAALFFIATAIPVIVMPGTFVPVSQDISLIGFSFFNVYIVPFELLSVIIVGAVIGVMYVARGEE
ncbi:TVG1162330 [Thermoplasma volcanium GSS1]|uniref:TVG1162330 protein n=1 Tax=Thermoplasma volcanium (strain ATCC 51530 / DSM 4299 / JCM 9571 / NBRC 15438 / GSS1) TaxID=273116 RepID=Q979M7_THEVO|nr:NADH dehydrogenase subunit J [Thermoplasma volcanium]BAB60275.1 TVG1162330 [Thermoplasma volcanium GSS1]